ncbi:hypothetical protein [Zavarzinia sp. CC-PAN008]|uniref:hypothetical protein n=1 Tax=Zavarzinia sp. CC-PAN008 TaxID=3243332 RepID=UPI003F7426B4
MVDPVPQTLADVMRRYQVVLGQCADCGHADEVPTTGLEPSLALTRLIPRLRCRICGSARVRIAVVRSSEVNWFKRAARR